MRNWIEGPTFIMLCENIFHPNEGLLSDQLFLEASKLLSQLYEINNNFAIAWPEQTGRKFKDAIECRRVANRSYFLGAISTEGAKMLCPPECTVQRLKLSD